MESERPRGRVERERGRVVEAPVVAWPSRREGITRAFRSRFERLSSVPRRNDRRKFGKVCERKPWRRGRLKDVRCVPLRRGADFPFPPVVLRCERIKTKFRDGEAAD